MERLELGLGLRFAYLWHLQDGSACSIMQPYIYIYISMYNI